MSVCVCVARSCAQVLVLDPCQSSGWMDRKLFYRSALGLGQTPIVSGDSPYWLRYKKPRLVFCWVGLCGDTVGWAAVHASHSVTDLHDSLLVPLLLSHWSRSSGITYPPQLSGLKLCPITRQKWAQPDLSYSPIWSMYSSVISMVTQLLNCYYPPLNLRPNLSTNIACPPRATIPLSWWK